VRRLTYLLCTFLVAVVVAAMIGWSIAAGNFLVPAVAIPLGVIVVLACRKNVEAVIADERQRKISSQAALRTLEVAVIVGAIAAVVLLSFMVSDTLTPKITGSVFTDGNGTNAMVINLYKPGGPETPENLIRTVTIPDINAMDEAEAMTYCQFRREALLENERNGIAGAVIGTGIFALLITFGAFYLYYNRKY
jgi:uncharacterized membrane protein